MKDKVVFVIAATVGLIPLWRPKLSTSCTRLVLVARNSDRLETLASQRLID